MWGVSTCINAVGSLLPWGKDSGWRTFAKDVRERLENTERRVRRLRRQVRECEQRHTARDRTDEATRREMKVLQDTHKLLIDHKDYTHEATHRILQPITAVSYKLNLLLMGSNVPLEKIEEAERAAKKDAAAPTIYE